MTQTWYTGLKGWSLVYLHSLLINYRNHPILRIHSTYFPTHAFLRDWADFFSRNNGFYYTLYSLLIFGFSYFWISIMFRPVQIADDLKKNKNGHHIVVYDPDYTGAIDPAVEVRADGTDFSFLDKWHAAMVNGRVNIIRHDATYNKNPKVYDTFTESFIDHKQDRETTSRR